MSEEKIHRDDERLDKMFRNSLGEMHTEPSANVWKKVNRRLLQSEILMLSFINVPKAYWTVIPAVVIMTGAALYFGLREGDTVSSEQPVTVVQPVTEQTLDEPTANEPSISIAPPPAKTTPKKATAVVILPTVEPTAEELTEIVTLPVIEPSIERTITEDLYLLTPLDAEINMTNLSYPLSISPVLNPVPAETPPEPARKPIPKSFDIGLNITPDMVFYRNPSSSFKYNYTFDAGAKYNLGRFYFQSGLGVSYSTAIGDYAISYIKNDSVGYYYTIRSYTVDPGEPGVHFETKQVTVYDSVYYLYDYNTKNKYLYFQIPLNFGYRIIDKPRWRLSVEAGLLYAYLLSINEPAPSFYMPESRILDIESRTPERNRHSLGLTGSVSIEYQFARNFYLLIEPTFKYYMQAIEESSSIGAKQPYSIGLRAGIWYRLNFKNKAK